MKRVGIAFVAFVAVCVSVEAWAVATGSPTISAQVQTFAAGNLQIWSGIVLLVGGLVGWFVCHFSSPVARMRRSVIEYLTFDGSTGCYDAMRRADAYEVLLPLVGGQRAVLDNYAAWEAAMLGRIRAK